MSLYLHPDITPETIKQAAEAGITGEFLCVDCNYQAMQKKSK